MAVTRGFYSIGNDEEHRTFEAQCEQGHYCVHGAKAKCPKGRYGSTAGIWANFVEKDRGGLKAHANRPAGSMHETSTGAEGDLDLCTGACDPGHYCPTGSVSPTQEKCPAGRYGAVHGLGDWGCSGKCERGFWSVALLRSLHAFYLFLI